MRSFTIHKISSGNSKLKSKAIMNIGRFESSNPASAAKKAGSSICKRKNLKEAKFVITIKEITQGSGHKLFTYKFSRTHNPTEINKGGNIIQFLYETHVKSVKRRSDGGKIGNKKKLLNQLLLFDDDPKVHLSGDLSGYVSGASGASGASGYVSGGFASAASVVDSDDVDLTYDGGNKKKLLNQLLLFDDDPKVHLSGYVSGASGYVSGGFASAASVVDSDDVDLTHDGGNKKNDGSNELPKIVVLSMDTNPNIESKAFLKTLKHFKYNTIVLRNIKSNQQPKFGKTFRYRFWRYRFDRYLESLEKICNNVFSSLDKDSIVVITDFNDVSVHASPVETINKFLNSDRDVIISGQTYCCNVDRIKYLKSHMTPEGFQRISKDENVLSYTVDKIWNTSNDTNVKPGLLGLPDAKKIINGLKINYENQYETNYRYVNAGTIIGRAKKILEVFKQIKNDADLYTDTLDDEGNLNLWFVKNLKKESTDITKINALIDYKQKIFAVVDELDNRPKELKELNGQEPSIFFPFTYDTTEQRFKNKYGNFPIFVHYAGIEGSGLHGIRRAFIEKLNEKEKIFDEDDEFIKKIQKCGNRK